MNTSIISQKCTLNLSNQAKNRHFPALFSSVFWRKICRCIQETIPFKVGVYVLHSQNNNHGWKKCPFSRELNQNFPPILLNFPPFLYVFLYFRGKISLQMSTFPGNQVPEFPIFSRHDSNIICTHSLFFFFNMN